MDLARKKIIYSNIFKVIMVMITCSIFFSLGFLVSRDGWIVGSSSYGTGVINVTKGEPKNIDFSNFWQAWNTVQRNYVGKINNQKMVDGAIMGMMSSLNDPYTVFLPSDVNSQFQEDISGHFDGIGIEVAVKDGKITVVSPLDGSPAQKVGIKAQDVIAAIDKKSTIGMSVEDVVKLIRGKSGTVVTLSITRAGLANPQDFKVTRGTIYVKSVKWEIKDGNIGYIKVSQFGEDTLGLFQQAVDDMVKKNPKGIIIDMRNNPGGLLNTAIDMASLVMKPGVVVKIKDKAGKVEVDRTTLQPKLLKPKMVILVDGGSASASEIFAGAIQDSKRGVVIGEKTFGKGSVQDLTPLPNGASIKVTIAKWLTPSGRQIDKKGIEPDIKVANPDSNTDAQLTKALEELKK